MFPKGFPRLGNGRGIDGGKAVVVHGPVRPGEVLSGRSEIADIYEKTGRSGTMIFVVHRTHFFNASGEEVSTVDWRLIQGTDPT
jgi:acyl dehydratase